MKDALTAKRRERVQHGMSTHDFWKGHQKRQAKRALKRALTRECQHEECTRADFPQHDQNWD